MQSWRRDLGGVMPRVKNSDPQQTIAKILSAARQLFVQQGYAGASMGRIAALAGVNHSLIFHHFTNKAGLWQAVKMQIVEEAQQHSVTLPSTVLPFNDFLKKLIKNTMAFYRNNPDIMRMIQWQRLEYDDHHAAAVAPSKETDRWMQAFRHYQQQGDIDASIKVEFVITMVLSILSSAAMDPMAFIAKKKDRDAYLHFVCDRLLIALMPG